MVANVSIPIPNRTKSAQWATLVIALVFFLIGAYLTEEKRNYTLCMNITFYLLILIVAEILYRLSLIYEEILYIPSRYANVIDVFIKAFKFSPEFLVLSVCFLFILFYILLSFGNPNEVPQDLRLFGWKSNICNIIGAELLITLIRPKYGPLYEALSINNISGLDYGTAMAYSFFYGYLNIVLPNRGNEQKGIKEHMHDFEAKHQITFSCDRLLVLIPLSLHCPASMEEKSKIVEKAQSFAEIQIDRAGVNKRSYKNTAYKINDSRRNKKVYISAEYATPLRTLLDITQHKTEHTSIYDVHKKELVLQFHLTVQNILNNDPDCKDCCDLIFFDDTAGDVDVGEVVLNHLERNAYI